MEGQKSQVLLKSLCFEEEQIYGFVQHEGE